MTNENVIMKIEPNYREYLTKAVYSIIPVGIGLIGFFIGIIALMSSRDPSETPISLGVLAVSGVLVFFFAIRIFAFYIRSNKAKNTSIKITQDRISGINANLTVDVEISTILFVNIEKASTDVGLNGIPKSLKADSFSELCALNSKYLNIRTNDGKNIYIDCIDSLEATKNTIDSLIAKNTAGAKS